MRYLVLTDIHANLEALETCLADGEARGFDRALVLGDVVGYGPDPNAVVARVRALDLAAIVRGNHDKVATGLEAADGFNVVARAAARWTLDTLTPETRAWVAALPTGPCIVDDFVEICHGSPFDEDAYIFDELDALRALKTAARPLCFFGHTHYPVTFAKSGDRLAAVGPSPAPERRLELDRGTQYLVNPGSVGQPRDGNARAAYAIADTDARVIELLRVEYPVEQTQAKIAAAGLPQVLGDRLAYGR